MDRFSKFCLLTLLSIFVVSSTVVVYNTIVNRRLLNSASDGNVQKVGKMLDLWADLEAKNEDGETALLLAAKNNHPDVVEYLLDAGANINLRRKDDHRNALSIASIKGHTEIVSILIKRGAVKNENLALVYAAENGHIETARFLLEIGQDINGHETGRTPLSDAVTENRNKMVKFLLENGADPDITLGFGDTYPLMIAVKNGNQAIVQMLIEAGADVNIRDEKHQIPLLYALREGDTATAKLLVKAGSEVNIIDPETVESTLSDMQKFQLRHGAVTGNISIEAGGKTVPASDIIESMDEYDRLTKKNGKTALMYAAGYGDLELVDMMIKAGANLKAKDKDGHTAAFYTEDSRIKKLLSGT